MNQLRGYVRLFRLERAFSAVMGVLLTGVIVKDLTGFSWIYAYACLSVFFSALANFALNDVHDIDSDRLNERDDRPLAVGIITRKTALSLTGVCVLLALVFAMFLPVTPQILILTGLSISLAYNVYLKRFLIFKNLFTGLANTGVILVGGLLGDNHLDPLVIYLALIGFFFSLSYEVMLDIADIKGDKANGVETIPSRFGTRIAAWFSVIIGLGAVFANPLPFFISFDSRLFQDPVFLALILVSVVNRLMISVELLRDQSPGNVRRLKKRLFRNLQIGGVGYLIGILF